MNEYHAAKAEFYKATGNPQMPDQISAAYNRYLEAVRQLRKFLEQRESPSEGKKPEE